jgi:hypothetical protein
MKHGGEIKVNTYKTPNIPFNLIPLILELKHRRQIHFSIRKCIFKAKTIFSINPTTHKFKLHFTSFQNPKRPITKHILKFHNRRTYKNADPRNKSKNILFKHQNKSKPSQININKHPQNMDGYSNKPIYHN